MQKIVGVKFGGSNKVYSFSCNDLPLNIGDDVIVDSALGLSYGTVVTKEKEIEDSEEIKNVIRLATNDDKKKWSQLTARASKDISVIKEKVKKLGLEMKIVSAEYTFDASKIIIEFSADDRVDFRELLKELAAALKVRIELHQVGQRDEVKIKGGIGPCGEICCCVRFLKDFEHVTVKMAKNQGLSLSPTKISGLCGRLMCCLGYENKYYEETLKKMPKINTEIDTPSGRGTVVYNDLLRERVSVKIKGNDDSFTIMDFGIEELKPNVSNGEEKVKNNLSKEDENTQTTNETSLETSIKPSGEGGEKTDRKKLYKKHKNFNHKKEKKNGIQNNR